MLAALLNVPRTNEEWAIWSWSHRASHDAIRQAIQSQLNINLVDYQVDPMDPHDIAGFLQRNSQLHLDATAAVGLQSHDLQDVNLSNESQKISWIFVHAQEHYDIESALGIGS